MKTEFKTETRTGGGTLQFSPLSRLITEILLRTYKEANEEGLLGG